LKLEISNQEDHSMRRREFIAGLGAITTQGAFHFDRAHGQGMSAITHRMIQANGIHLHIAEQGEGPLVVMCHGFPECWYSWRHQLAALSAAGFHAVAVDMRGYGQSDRPEAIDQYTLLHLVSDMVGVLDALGAEQAVIAGHDWGAPVAWRAALLRPDRFRAVIALSVPYASSRGSVPPTSVMPRTNDAQFYQLYFQQPGKAEAEFERDVRQNLPQDLGECAKHHAG
jgi:pimeloyl-ACP methyl ester carboxylesterase